MELVDAHCHFDFPQFDGRRQAILGELGRLGISRVVIPGVRRADWSRVTETAALSGDLYYCLGIHPWFVGEHDERDLEALRSMLAEGQGRCVALGECGLDRLRGSLQEQLPWFERQVAIASELGMPLVVHSVRAHDQVAAVIRRLKPGVPMLIHGFSGSVEQAKMFASLGCSIGVGGVITHERARKTRQAVAELPLGLLVLETDAPDMSPQGVEKGMNSPVYLPRILECLASLRTESVPELAQALTANARTLFRWDKGYSK